MVAQQIKVKLQRAPEIGETLYDFNSPIGKVTSVRLQEDGKWLLEVEVEWPETFTRLQKKLKKRWNVATRTGELPSYGPGPAVEAIAEFKKAELVILACGNGKKGPMGTKANKIRAREKEVDAAAARVKAEIEGNGQA